MAQSLVSGTLRIAADIRFDTNQLGADGATQFESFSQNAYSALPSDANLFFHKAYTLSSSGTQDIELDNLTDHFGNTIVFAKIYAFAIRNLSSVSGRYILIGDTDFAAWLGATGDKVKLGPLGMLFLASPTDGYTVTPTSADTMTITNGTANSVDIKVTIIGKS